jgi:hypothetical protein
MEREAATTTKRQTSNYNNHRDNKEGREGEEEQDEDR